LEAVYETAGKLEEALRLYEQTLKLRQAKLGPDHPSTLWSMSTLAIAYGRAGKNDQALPLVEETLKLGKAKLGPNHPDTLQFMLNLAIAYSTSGKFDQALPLLEETLKLMEARDHPSTQDAIEVLKLAYLAAGKLDLALLLVEEKLKLTKAKLGPEHHDTLTAMRRLADVRARRGQFAEAAADLVGVREVDPENHEVWHQLAALLVASGQVDDYRELCRKSAERFGKTTHPLTAERIAKDCLILPASGADLAVVAKMADIAAAATNHLATPRFQLAKGLAEYRQGRFASAVDRVNKTLTATGKESGRDVEAYMVLAMAHYQLKQTDKALSAYASGVEIERTDLPKLESGDIGGGWLDWIIAHALMREAKEMIEGDAIASAVLKDLGDSPQLKAVRLKKAEALRAAAEKGDVSDLNRLAWFLATCSDSAIRDGRRAVGYAEMAVAKTDRKDPGYLDTLAAAYAEAGEFAKAADVQREAIRLCQDDKTKDDLTARLKLYESNTPYRE
jgi:tetratricopeptide (TPR) repeat protein